MKKYLLSMLIAMFAIVSFAQPTAMKQKGVRQLTSIVGAEKVTPKKSLNLRPMGKSMKSPITSFEKKVRKQTMRRTEGEFTIDDLAGDYVQLQYLYEYEDETAQYPTPNTPSRMATQVNIEVGESNQITIYGLWGNLDYGVTGTVDPETFKVIIPAGQVILSYEGYGDFKMINAESETGMDDFTATIYDDGIQIDQLWFASLEGTRYSNFFSSFLAFPNGTMQFIDDASTQVDALVYVEQDSETKTVSVFNFGDFGACVDIDLLSDKTFYINPEQPVIDGSKGYFYPIGINETGTALLDFTGKATETMLTCDVTWTLYCWAGSWYGVQQPFTIELIDGSEFEFPEALLPVTLPEGLTPTSMPSYYTTGNASNREKHTGTVNVAMDGTDVYIQGIDLQIPEAWVKGSRNEETGLVVVPVTYMGKVEDTPHYFGAYGATGEATDFIFEYNAETNTYYSPDWVEFYQTPKAGEIYYYGGLLIGTKPTAVSIPEGLATVELPYTGNFLDTQTEQWVEKSGTVKIAKSGNLVYIQGLYSSSFDADCIVGQVMEIENTKLLVIPSGEFVGELGSGFLTFVLSYTIDSETSQMSSSNIIFSYDDENNFLTLLTPLILSTSSYDVNRFIDLARAGLTIGTDPSGIEAVKSVKEAGNGAWYTINGQRVAQPTQKGLYIHNGRKVVIK